jgi:uncharacterized protein (DUF362 family)
MQRREFIKSTAISAGALLISSNISQATEIRKETPLVKTVNASPELLVSEAVKALGGMNKFISKGDRVVVKPNIGWDRSPEQAANTNPLVVAEIIKLCLEAGASEVQVFDFSCNTANRCYDNSGIAEAAKKAGAKVSFIIESFFKDVKISDGKMLKSWKFYKPAMDTDKYINVPILKHHGLAMVTAGMKNIMGVIGGNRGSIHRDFDTKIVDLNTVIKPALTIVDATRILRRNGPTGGSLSDVETPRVIIAGTDPVAVDAASAKFFGVPPVQLGVIAEAEERGLGTAKYIDNMKIIDLKS